ncbi:MAG: YwaF family protein [Clostridium sp.]
MRPEIYGWQHLTFEAIFIIFLLVSLFYIKRFVDEKYYVYIIKIFAVVNLFFAILCRFSIFNFQLDIRILPDSFCSVSSFLTAFCLLFSKKDSKILQFALFAGVIGGVVTNAYPEFVPNHEVFFNIETISSLLFHSGMVYLFIMTITLGYFKPTMKKWGAFPCGLYFYFLWGGLSNTYIGQVNAMYLNEPLMQGTIFNCYVTGVMLVIVYTTFIYVYEKIDARYEVKVTQQLSNYHTNIEN